MKKFLVVILALICVLSFAACTNPNGKTKDVDGSEITLPELPNDSKDDSNKEQPQEGENEPMFARYTASTKISDVINDPVFGNFGRFIFPVNSGYYSGDTLAICDLLGITIST